MTPSCSVRLSTPQVEGTLRVSKWLKYQLLLDDEEMRALCAELGSFFIFNVSEAVSPQETEVSLETFLTAYSNYVNLLKRGEVPQDALFRRVFSSIFTVTPEILYGMDVGRGRMLVKPIKPVIQLQAHHFFISSVDGKFHPMVLGDESVSWGLQLSYPQIYQDPKTHAFSSVVQTQEFPNTELFARAVKWIRTHTRATPFVYQGVKTNVPMRIGKQCLGWIHSHPQLVHKGLHVSC